MDKHNKKSNKLQAQHSVDKSSYIMDKHNKKSNKLQASTGRRHINAYKETRKKVIIIIII
jgi:hypothetical protein